MTMAPFVVDAEVIDESSHATGFRARLRAARARLSRLDDHKRVRSLRADAALVGDGLRGRQLARREREQLAEYRHNGDPSQPVREDLRSHYERAKDRQERAADEDDMSMADAIRYGSWGVFGVCELVFCAWLIGGLSGGYWMLGLLVCVANIVAAPLLWRRLRREGQTYRAKLAAWQRGASPSEDAEGDHSAASLTGVFAQAGILREGGPKLSLAEPVSSDHRSFTARVVLPGGVTVGMVRGKLDKLASAFDVYPQQIQIGSGESERRLVLRVFRELPFTGEPVPSPLIGSEGRSLAAGVPIGADINGEPVTLSLAKGRHGLVVASSGNGKTVLLQNIASAAVLDTAATLTVLDGKPDGSYTEYRSLCFGYVTTAQDDPLARAADLLEKLCERMDDRLTRAENGTPPEGDDVIILDEFQEWTGSLSGGGMGKGEPKPRIRAALDRLARRGRSARMRLVLASQDYDGRQLDDAILTNIGWRAVGYAPSDMSKQALGDLAKRFGLDTSVTFVDEVQTGAAIVAGGGVHPYRAMRSYLQTPRDVKRIVETGRKLRAAAPQAATETAQAGDDSQADQHDSGRELDGSTAAALDDDTAALLRGVLEVYGDDDAAWIPTETLVSEVAVGELGRTHDRKTTMDVAAKLTGIGASKQRPPAGEADNRAVSWHRPTLVTVARQALGEK